MAEFEFYCNYFLLSLSSCYVYADDVCISVEMYKCEHMVDTCVECLSPADVMDTKYNCGWCQHLSSSCQVAQLCPTNANFLEANKSNCPFLEISQVRISRLDFTCSYRSPSRSLVRSTIPNWVKLEDVSVVRFRLHLPTVLCKEALFLLLMVLTSANHTLI